MANNEYVNKVQFGNTTVMDISDTTAEEGTVVEGYTFYTRSGAPATGTLTDATTSTHGLMSSTDKAKLDGIATGANNYTLPTASSTTKGGIVIDSNLSPFTIWTNPFTNLPILTMNFASATAVQGGSAASQVSSVARQHEAVFFGLSKAAGIDLANETVTFGTYPETSKIAIQTMLGVPSTAVATTSAAGLMSAADKIAIEDFKSLRLSVDNQGYIIQTITEEAANNA